MTALLPYLGILAGMLFEGDLLLFGTTFLSLHGTLDWRFALPAAAIGALAGDLGWYWLGYRLKPDAKPAAALRKLTKVMDGRMDGNSRRALFLSKITYGLHRPIQMRFGLERFGVWRFFKADLLATAVWFAVIMALAFLAHLTFLPVSHYLRILEVILLFACVLFVFLDSGMSRIVRRSLDAETKPQPETEKAGL